MLQGWDPTWTVRRIDAAAALDGAGTAAGHASGVSAVIERRPDGSLTLAALGPTDQIETSDRWAGAPVTDRRGCLLIPGLVNAHTHLDLTHIGPRPYDPVAGFAPWIDMIRRERHSDQPAIAAAVSQGVTRSLAGGTVLVGDIAGAVAGTASEAPGRALAGDGRVNGVSYVEYFAHGDDGPLRAAAAVRAWQSLDQGELPPTGRVVFGVQPHAPYSVGLEFYRPVFEAIETRTPVCTHVAESAAEHRFIAEGEGPFRTLLERLGIWNERVAHEVGSGRSPIEHLAGCFDQRTIAAVHCNDVSPVDLAILARSRTPVLYCPRSSAYFAADRDFGPHRYREMLAAGIVVALGTDSIVNLDTPQRISTWDEMRFLHQRDGVDPILLLRMATINGASALGRESTPFSLTSMGTLAGLVAIPVPNANPRGNPTELLDKALSATDQSGRGGETPELVAIGRV